MAESYEKYRWFFTSSKKLVMGGKSSEQNEEIMTHVFKDDVVMHTASPGSPFCVIRNPNAKDIEECAIFTACFSHEWKKLKERTEVHIFKGEQIVKEKEMKQGTFGILGNVAKKKVGLVLALTFQNDKLRAVPLSAAKNKIAILTPGDMDKNQAAKKISRILKDKCDYSATLQEIMSAIPADKINVKA